ncbi:MAG: Integral membrane sensor signal transduction histidine kinase [uncultured Thiotrichaceae bacterium]|uniref:histidine kinase n=1 Tax=uncultured Thiotrichaceae bacterium TaxID=298394 RepID=A0A6S6UC15_9GAMM|nr:MAG: Integral membrane sensor signal transduction histidine kinase [uncultured Thiotrichaceae bacterium]
MPNKKQKIAAVLALLVYVFSVLSLFAWLTGKPALYVNLTPFITNNIYPVSSIVLLLLANSLLLQTLQEKKYQQINTISLVLLAMIIAGIEFSSVAFSNRDFSINAYLLSLLPTTDTPKPLTFQVAAALVLFSLSCLLLYIRNFYTVYTSQITQIFIISMIITVSYGYIYNQRTLLEYTKEIGMTFFESLLFILLSLSMLFLKTNEGFLKIASGNSSGAILIRNMLPVIVVLPLILGWVSYLGFKYNFYSERFGAALLQSVTVMLTASILILLAHIISFQETQRKKAERETLRMQQDLAHIVRVNSMGELASGIAHELNQPLAAIQLYAAATQRMIEQTPENKKIDKNLESIKEQTQRVSEIIKRMRSFLRKQQPKVEKVEIEQCVDDVITLLQHKLYQQNIRVVKSFDYPIPMVKVDSIQMTQVILNLFQNAIDAMRNTLDRPSLITVRIYSKRRILHVEINDTGSGISNNEAEDIFNTFFSTKGEDGLGVGLSICRTIIEAHNGRLWFESKENEGSTFFFTLPLA